MPTPLRIADLKRRSSARSVVINIGLPLKLHNAVAQLSRRIGASKAAVFTALLVEGLDVAARRKLVSRDGKGR
jgi:hypothetical protein